MIEFFLFCISVFCEEKKIRGNILSRSQCYPFSFHFIYLYLSISRLFKIAFMVSRQGNGVRQAFYSCIFIYLFMFISNYLSIFLSRCGSYYLNWPVSCRSLFFSPSYLSVCLLRCGRYCRREAASCRSPPLSPRAGCQGQVQFTLQS